MKNGVNAGGVGIWLDEIVPCLKDIETGEIKETVVFRIESRSFLRQFNEKNGWGINWIKTPKEVEVFALNRELLNHYIDVLGATYLGALHPYQFAVKTETSRKLLEVIYL